MSQQSVQLRVRNENHAPPGGWSVRHRDPDLTDSDSNLQALLERTQAWLIRQRLDPAIAHELIHDATGRRLIAQGHKDMVEQVGEVKRKPAQYAAGAQAMMLKWWRESPIAGLLQGKFERGESVLVEQEEADRRAAICVSCPSNVKPTGKNWLQNWTDGKMLDAVMGRKVEQHNQLGVCRDCGGCELRAAVWWPLDILSVTTPKADLDKFPEHCWKRKALA